MRKKKIGWGSVERGKKQKHDVKGRKRERGKEKRERQKGATNKRGERIEI